MGEGRSVEVYCLIYKHIVNGKYYSLVGGRGMEGGKGWR